MFTRIKDKVYMMYISMLSTKHLIVKAKKYIKKSNYLPIAIMYHRVTDKAKDSLSVSKEKMERDILLFQKFGFEFLFEEEFDSADNYSVVLTFDDGYRDNYTNLLPLLTKHKAKASVNIIAKKIVDEFEADYLSVDEIKEMLESGCVSIQSHAYSHRKLLECSETELEFELKKSKEALEEVLGINCSVLVTPYLQNSRQIIEIAKKHYDLIYSGQVEGADRKYCISRIGSSESMTEKQLARCICLKAKENAKNARK